MLYPCILCVALLMCMFVLCVACLTVFVNCLVKQFAMCVGVVAILLLYVMDVFSVCGGALLDRPCMVFQRVCVLCLWSQWASKCSFHMFVCVFVCRKLSPHLGDWELDHRCLPSLCYFFEWFCIQLDHRCLLSLCYFFEWFCILWLRARACSCCASCPLVCSACLPSVWCLWKFCWQCVCW